MKSDPKTAAGRAFVRSLNILMKYARLYGYEHARTVEQLNIAYDELRTAIPLGSPRRGWPASSFSAPFRKKSSRGLHWRFPPGKPSHPSWRNS